MSNDERLLLRYEGVHLRYRGSRDHGTNVYAKSDSSFQPSVSQLLCEAQKEGHRRTVPRYQGCLSELYDSKGDKESLYVAYPGKIIKLECLKDVARLITGEWEERYGDEAKCPSM